MDFLNSLNYPNQPLTVERIVTTFVVTMVVALLIFCIYRLTFRGVLYTRSFNVGLVMTALVTALIIMPISSNILLALGAVGALSIVRFRTPIKDPMDLVFMFWAIAVGVACGAGLFLVSLVGSPMIGVFIFVFNWANRRPGAEPYVLVIHYAGEAETRVKRALPAHKIRSRIVSATGVELILEVRMKAEDTTKIDRLLKIKGVKDAALVSYSGDYVS